MSHGPRTSAQTALSASTLKAKEKTPTPSTQGSPKDPPLSPVLFALYSSPPIPNDHSETELKSINVDDDTMLQEASTSEDTPNMPRRPDHQGSPPGPQILCQQIRSHPPDPPPTSKAANPNDNQELGPRMYAIRTTPKDTLRLLGVTINRRLFFRENTDASKTKVLSMLPTL